MGRASLPRIIDEPISLRAELIPIPSSSWNEQKEREQSKECGIELPYFFHARNSLLIPACHIGNVRIMIFWMNERHAAKNV